VQWSLSGRSNGFDEDVAVHGGRGLERVDDSGEPPGILIVSMLTELRGGRRALFQPTLLVALGCELDDTRATTDAHRTTSRASGPQAPDQRPADPGYHRCRLEGSGPRAMCPYADLVSATSARVRLPRGEGSCHGPALHTMSALAAGGVESRCRKCRTLS